MFVLFLHFFLPFMTDFGLTGDRCVLLFHFCTHAFKMVYFGTSIYASCELYFDDLKSYKESNKLVKIIASDDLTFIMQIRPIFLPDKAQMGCSLDDVYADVLYSTRRCNSSRMDFVNSDMRCQLQQFKRLFIQRDIVVIPLG